MRMVLMWGGGFTALIAILVAIVVIVGASLPVAHRAQKSATFAVPADKLFDMAVTVFNRTNDGSYAIVAQQRPTQFVTAIAKKDLPYGGSWTFDLAPNAGGTTLTITENGEVYNPFFRFMSRYVFGYDSSIDAFLAALRKDAPDSKRG